MLKKLLVISIVFINSCLPPERLKFNRENYLGNSIRMDGYYYDQTTSIAFDGQSTKMTHFTFFYRNGVVLKYNSNGDIEFLERQLMDSAYLKNLKRSMYSYGLYKIDGDKIEINAWSPPTGGRIKNYIISLEILNDTTLYYPYFKINQSFRLFKNKPDSISPIVEMYKSTGSN